MKNITEEYSFVTVWKKNSFGISEKCSMTNEGYLGKDSGNLYPLNEGYYHSEQFLAKVRSIDERNETGMIHLNEEWSNRAEENAKSLKTNFLGRELIVEKAHYAGERTIYRSVFPVFEYWSDLELEIGEKIR